MRIIRGKFGRRRFNVPGNISARPTTDFARENLFNVLENMIDFDGLTAIDLFAAALAVKSRNGKVLGHIGLVAKKLLRKFDISLPVAFAELDWEALCRLAGKQKVEFTPLPKTLPVRRDLALLVDRQVTFADIESVVRQAGGKLLSDVELFDVYEGENLPAGKKSYAVTFTLQDPEKTLADKQIEAAVARIVANLAKRTGAELR